MGVLAQLWEKKHKHHQLGIIFVNNMILATRTNCCGWALSQALTRYCKNVMLVVCYK